MALDNRVEAVKPDTQPVPVTLVSQGNRFIKTALSLLPGVVLHEQIDAPLPSPNETPVETTPSAEPTQAEQNNPDTTPAALTIYDNNVPTDLAKSGSLLFIAPTASTEYFSTTGLVKNPILRPVDLSDPLLNNLSLTDVNILDAVQIPLPTWATP